MVLRYKRKVINMKKFSIILLVSAYFISVCSCGASTDGTQTDAPETTVSEPAAAVQNTAAASGNPTPNEQTALECAINYLDATPLSYSGLIKQLEFEQYSHSEAVYAADHCGADWNEQAARQARRYNRISSPSRDDLIDQLISTGFTEEQTVFGADAVFGAFDGTADEKKALDEAFAYLDVMAFSYSGLIEMLEFVQYPHSEAVYAADHCGADWNEQAARCVREHIRGEYDEETSYSREDLIDRLISEGFTEEQAVYGAEANGY